MSTARELYNASVRRCPKFIDGTDRPAFDDLTDLEKWGWEHATRLYSVCPHCNGTKCEKCGHTCSIKTVR